MSVTAAALDRSHLVVPRSRTRAVPAARISRRGRVLSLLVALVLGAGTAIWLLMAAYPGIAASWTAPPAAPAPPAEIVAPATVVAASSCMSGDAHDTVAVDVAGDRRQVPLDACGSLVGSVVTVRVAPDANVPARVLGTGGAGALSGDETSPMTARMAITLTAVAGVGMAGLLVAVLRERAARARRSRPGARPTRPSRGSGRPGAPGDRIRTSPSRGRAPTRRPVPGHGRPGTASGTCRTVRGSRPADARPSGAGRGRGSRRPAGGSRRH